MHPDVKCTLRETLANNRGRLLHFFEFDVLELDLHRWTSVNLERKHAAGGRLLFIFIDNF